MTVRYVNLNALCSDNEEEKLESLFHRLTDTNNDGYHLKRVRTRVHLSAFWGIAWNRFHL